MACFIDDIFRQAATLSETIIMAEVRSTQSGEMSPASGAVKHSALGGFEMLSGQLTRWTGFIGNPIHPGHFENAGAIGILKSGPFYVTMYGYEEVRQPNCEGTVLTGQGTRGIEYTLTLHAYHLT
jgi:hypothetical protein